MSKIYYNANLDIIDCDMASPLGKFDDIDDRECAVHLDSWDVCLTSKLDDTLGFSDSDADIHHRSVRYSYSSDEVYQYLKLILLNASEVFLK